MNFDITSLLCLNMKWGGIFFAVWVFASAPSIAQPISPPPVQDIREEPSLTPVDAEKRREIFDAAATCTYRRNKDLVIDFLMASDPGGVSGKQLGLKWDEFTKASGFRYCLGRSASRVKRKPGLARISPRMLRGWLARAAYTDENRAERPAWLLNQPVAPSRSFVTTGARLERAKLLSGFADCVLFRAPVQTDAYLRSDYDSGDEAETLQELLPILSACIREGDEIELTHERLKGVLADALWTLWAANVAELIPMQQAMAE